MTRIITYRDALNEAMFQEMHRDESVFTYGIDVGDHKRIFGSTNGLVEEFGDKRCFSTPLCEDAMTGFGFGAAINGLRPVHVHMRVDFMLLAMNQLTNMVACHTEGCDGAADVPMVIRAVVGRGWGQAWQHSKTMHSVFGHIPGLKVVMPSRPEDAKGMLASAIRENSPVVFIEHRWLYDVPGPVPETVETLPLEGAKVLRQGTDVTVAALSWMTVEALKAAEVLEKRGVSVEIVDLRSVSPLDHETVCKSVSKTGRLVAADYDWVPFGLASELAANVYENCFGTLKSPIKRLGFGWKHCPCTRPLENGYYSGAMDIIRDVEALLDLKPADLSEEDFYSYERKFKGPF